MSQYTYEEHSQRLRNLQLAERNVVSCIRKNMITNYIPGQFIYAGKCPGTPQEDEKFFTYLKECGVGIVQLWSGWFEGRWRGKEMFRPADPEGTRRFLEEAHNYGIKVLPYTATNFFERTDEYFNPTWAHEQSFDLVEFYYHLAHCSANSPGWRTQILHQLTALLDDYDFDGIYNDTGYIRKSDYPHVKASMEVADDICAFREARDFDGGMQDMMAIIYSEVKRRNGIVKIHKDGADTIHTTEKIYDYLWVGEGVDDINAVREKTKCYAPYVVPDFNFATQNENERYLNTIPFMQFPVLRDGTTGIASANAAVPDTVFAMQWLKLYKKMATEAAWFYMDVEAPGIIRRKGLSTVVSLFVNLEFYAVLANFSEHEDMVVVNGQFVVVDPVSGEKQIGSEVLLPPRGIVVIKRKNLE